jgi:hypothetical protein
MVLLVMRNYIVPERSPVLKYIVKSAQSKMAPHNFELCLHCITTKDPLQKTALTQAFYVVSFGPGPLYAIGKKPSVLNTNLLTNITLT